MHEYNLGGLEGISPFNLIKTAPKTFHYNYDITFYILLIYKNLKKKKVATCPFVDIKSLRAMYRVFEFGDMIIRSHKRDLMNFVKYYIYGEKRKKMDFS